MNNHYPGRYLAHKSDKLSVARWLEIISDFYEEDFTPESTGRPTKLSKDEALKLFSLYADTGYMTYALQELGIQHSTEWRWRKRYRSIHDMHMIIRAINVINQRDWPSFWRF